MTTILEAIYEQSSKPRFRAFQGGRQVMTEASTF
jgi:hypothetical protein